MFSCVRARGEIKHPQQMISHQRGDRLVLEFCWGFAGQICYLMDIALALRRILSHANTGFRGSVSRTLWVVSKISTYSVFPPVCVCCLTVCSLERLCFGADRWNEWSQAGQAELR